MRKSAFDVAWAVIQDAEGAATVTNDPDDPGGLTKYGIAQRFHPGVDVGALTEDEAKAIFERAYWLPASCSDFSPSISVALADAAFNHGVSKAVRLLQQALRVPVDGVPGSDTLAAANRVPPGELLVEFLSRRAVAYSEGNPKYRRGWFRRLFRLQAFLAGVEL